MWGATTRLVVPTLVALVAASSGFFPRAAWAKEATIYNDRPRLDTSGEIVNAHDGGVYEFNGTNTLHAISGRALRTNHRFRNP